MAKDRTQTVVRTVSFVLHAVAFGSVAAISTGHVPEPIAVMMASVVEPEAAPPAPTPPPPLPMEDAPAPRARRAPAPDARAASAAEATSPTDTSSAPDYGIALAGVASGPGGIAVPIGDPGGVRGESGTTRSAARMLAPAPEPERVVERRCREEDRAPRQRSMPRVVYTPQAMAAGVEGRVRLTVRLDAEGRVLDADVLSSLGHGLDEAALDAVRRATFEPATHCGRPIPTSFVLGVRFQL